MVLLVKACLLWHPCRCMYICQEDHFAPRYRRSHFLLWYLLYQR